MPYDSKMAQNKYMAVRLGPQGRIVIPAPVRRRLGVSPGDELALTVDDQRLILEPRAAAAARARGMFRHLATEVSAVDELIADRRQEAARDETG